MKNITALQEYLKTLYETYDTFQTEYKYLHKRSKMHNQETAAAYYLRWRDKMREEIQRVEKLLLSLLTCPSINTTLNVEKNQLQNVA